jgi:hypothetical protein
MSWRWKTKRRPPEWLLVRNTLNEFCKAYDVFVERIEGRRR